MNSITKNTGIPTTFNHRRYRSRLEAKWAAFFDLLGWNYEYEPFDCNGWIPDFSIIGKDGNQTLVEVKPVASFPKEVSHKIDLAETNHEVVIVGVKPFVSESYANLGWLRESHEDGDGCIHYNWTEAPFGMWEGGNGTIGFCSESGSYRDRVSGGYDGGNWGGVSFNHYEVARLWDAASNAVQWRGK
jgi:hypothetical protein